VHIKLQIPPQITSGPHFYVHRTSISTAESQLNELCSISKSHYDYRHRLEGESARNSWQLYTENGKTWEG